jgi:hypothetical protein
MIACPKKRPAVFPPALYLDLSFRELVNDPLLVIPRLHARTQDRLTQARTAGIPSLRFGLALATLPTVRC